MNTEPEILVALLAIRLLGGEDVPSNAEPAKSMKKHIEAAVTKNLLTKGKIRPLTKSGRPGSREIDAFSLSDDGIQLLNQACGAEAAAVASAATIRTMQEELTKDRTALQAEIQAAFSKQSKSNPQAKIQKDVDALGKKVNELAKQLEKIETRLAATDNDSESAVIAKLDHSFALFQERLEKALQGLPAAADASATVVPSPQTTSEVNGAPPKSESVSEPPPDLEQTIRAAHAILSRYRQYEDGLVAIPHIYKEVVTKIPTLSVSDFQQKLMELWDAEIVELHILNEVRTAKEPDKAVHWNDSLYYFLTWEKP